jgi:methylated-DNA-[protein]-cysteine S-methyltransferase
MTNTTTYTSTLIGPLTLVGSDGKLAALHFGDRGANGDPRAFAQATAQLDEYFAGERQAFDLELDIRGTDFQLSVWNELRELPYGETISYGELARRVGRPEHVRAVAGAVARTPIPIVVPCHRVIGANRSLTGYLGGIERKAALLELESGVIPLAA